jgi:hypothetical protein
MGRLMMIFFSPMSICKLTLPLLKVKGTSTITLLPKRTFGGCNSALQRTLTQSLVRPHVITWSCKSWIFARSNWLMNAA